MEPLAQLALRFLPRLQLHASSFEEKNRIETPSKSKISLLTKILAYLTNLLRIKYFGDNIVRKVALQVKAWSKESNN